MLSRIVLIVVLLTVLPVGLSNATFFFPEDGGDVKNYKNALPEGYDDPDVIYGRNAEQLKIHLNHFPLLEINRSNDFIISTSILNMPEGATVLAHYRSDPLNQYKVLQLKEVTAGRYSTSISSHAIDSDQIQYYIEVVFAGDRLANSGDFGNPHNVRVIGSGRISKFGIYAMFAMGGIWIVSRLRKKKTVEKTTITTRRKRRQLKGV
ncbi:MAG: hypothetical protein GY855_15935 [candidate division Zixibacteria bacterium]|nr:hypothetical protein [candidate division Zixibacteria bacterium]